MKKLKLLSAFIQGNRWIYFAAIVSMCIATFLAAAIPSVIRITIDTVIGGKPYDGPGWMGPFLLYKNASRLWIALSILILLTAMQGLFQFLRGKFTSIASENARRKIRDRLYRHLIHLPYDDHVKAQAGDLIQRYTSDVDTVSNFISGQLVETASTIASLIFALSMMISMNVQYTLVSVVFLPVLLLYALKFFKSMQKLFMDTDKAEGHMSVVLQENLTGVRVVRAFGTQELEIRKFDASSEEYKDKGKSIVHLMANFWSSSDLFCMLQMGIVLMAGVYWASNDIITLGTLVAFTTYSGMLIWPIRGLGQILAFMGQAFVSLGRIQEILDKETESDFTGPNLHEIEGEIAFDHVYFGYDPDRPVLRDLTFKIRKGQTAAILGATGSGKSSLVHLLLRLYDYQSGSITLDGIELKDIPRKDIRKQIGIVLQEPFLFSKTIIENVRMGKPAASNEEVFEACDIAAIHHTIHEFEKGYDTVVGERGVTLSGGQRQRTAIARAVIRNVPILVFDDSLSAVDMETDAQIRCALKEKSKDTTAIIISHRITTLAEADVIFVLGEGKIRQTGTHEQLIRQEGLYRKVWELQTSAEEEMDFNQKA